MMNIKDSTSATVFTPNRLEALSDAVFAIVMTLLVLEFSIPEIEHPSLQAELPRRLLELGPKFFSYVLSFIVLGFLWSHHHQTFHYIKRCNNQLIWLNILYLMFIALIPFSTSLIGNYGAEQLSVIIYTTNYLLGAFMGLMMWTYATGKYRLVDSDISPRLVKRQKIATSGACLTVVLIIGISFINITAALSIFTIFMVGGLATQFIMRRMFE